MFGRSVLVFPRPLILKLALTFLLIFHFATVPASPACLQGASSSRVRPAPVPSPVPSRVRLNACGGPSSVASMQPSALSGGAGAGGYRLYVAELPAFQGCIVNPGSRWITTINTPCGIIMKSVLDINEPPRQYPDPSTPVVHQGRKCDVM